MPDISLFTKSSETITLTYQGESISVTYLPALLTPRWEAEFNEALRGDWKSGALVQTLAAILECWDLTANGEPFPPTGENLMRLPVDFLVAVFMAIMEHQAPKATGSGFGSGS